MKRWLAAAAVIGLVSAAAACGDGRSAEPSGMVAAAHPEAVEAGLEILRAGGSAVDAAIAVQATLGLVEPQSSGLGGGAFMLHYDARTRQISAYDGRETAPAAATPDMFVDDLGEPLDWVATAKSGRSIGVPGVVDLLRLAHQDYGRLAWARALEPAITRAEAGFTVTPRLAELLKRFGQYGLIDDPAGRTLYFDAAGEPLEAGAILANPPYADTLRTIAADPRAFYEGPIADAIVAAARREPDAGVLARADLSAYQARRVEPICADYRDKRVCGPPPPSSGGVTVLMILGLLDRFTLSRAGAVDPVNWRLFGEAQRLAYVDRDRYVADPDVTPVPLKGLMSPKYLAKRAELITPLFALETVEPGDPWAYETRAARKRRDAYFGEDASVEAPGTSHFVVVDAQGDVVSMTTTVESAFGSGRMAAGMILNNQLTDFSFRPIDAAGRPIANAPGPGKRPRSSMAPMILLERDGDFFMATGSPGGNSIIAYVAKTIVGVVDWGLSPQAAADLPNLVARPQGVSIEFDRANPALVTALSSRGYDLRDASGEASGVHIVLRRADGALEGGADSRREGQARTP